MIGFVCDVFNDNQANLIAMSFNAANLEELYIDYGIEETRFFETDRISEAIEHFKLFIKDGQFYKYTEEEKALDDIGISKDEANAFRDKVNEIIQTFDDDTAISNSILFPKWAVGVSYNVGDRRRFLNELYKCLQAHTSTEEWTPDVAVSLWVRIDDPSIEWPAWRQPTGAQDAYMIGDKVSHAMKHWICDVDNNTWEPGVYGWIEQ